MKDADLIAAYLAKGGKVTQLQQGDGAYNHRNSRDWYKANRGEQVEKTDNDLIAERHVRGDVVYNGLGEIIGKV